MSSIRRTALVLAAVTALGGCETARFGGSGRAPSQGRSAVASAPSEPVVAALPSGSVTSEPLAPLSGPVAPAPNLSATSGPPPLSGTTGPVDGLNPATPPSAAPISVPSGPGSRSATIGAWTARDASGTCRVQLTSAPTLDLYKASASTCANKDLGRVTAWDFRDGDVYLYQPGGAVAARLRSSNGELSGVLAKSGAPLTLTR